MLFVLASLPLLPAFAALTLTLLLLGKFRHGLLGEYAVLQGLVLLAYATEPASAFLAAQGLGGPARQVVVFAYAVAMFILAFRLPLFCRALTGQTTSGRVRVGYLVGLLAWFVLAAGAARSEIDLLALGADVAFYASWVAGVVTVVRHQGSLPKPLKEALSAMYTLLLVFVPLFIAETLMAFFPATVRLQAAIPFSPAFAIYVLVWNALNVEFARRAFFRPSVPGEEALPPAFSGEFGLTPAEEAVAALVIAGYGNKEIAFRRHVTERTIKNQVSSIYQKTATSNRVGLTNLVQAFRD